ncbi:uncharacterized protein LOC128929904 [Callithrix jacchus]
MAVTSGVRERTRPLPHARARAHTHTQRHAHARAQPISLRHTGGKGQTKGERAERPEGAAAAAARHDGRGGGCFPFADAAEPLLSPRPLPPARPSTRRWRVPAPPPPAAPGARRAWGAGCREREGGGRGGRAASSRDPRPRAREL